MHLTVHEEISILYSSPTLSLHRNYFVFLLLSLHNFIYCLLVKSIVSSPFYTEAKQKCESVHFKKTDPYPYLLRTFSERQVNI